MSHASHEFNFDKKQNKSNRKYLGLVYPIERTLQAGQELDIGIFADNRVQNMAVWILQAMSLLLISSSFRLVDGQGNSRPPNILFLLADDLGWYDVGYHNPKIQTPNINKLVKGGVLLNNYYVQQVCTPTRGSVMTGRYPIHTGIWTSTVKSEAWANSTPKALAKVSVLSERPKTKHKNIRFID